EPKSAEYATRVFLTPEGFPWGNAPTDNPVAKRVRRLLKALDINGRKGLGFYTLRHVFRTVADAAKDQPAADFIMGHEVPHMSTVYREIMSEERLTAVADHVRRWLLQRAEHQAARPARGC